MTEQGHPIGLKPYAYMFLSPLFQCVEIIAVCEDHIFNEQVTS